jgi:hypothetical protein
MQFVQLVAPYLLLQISCSRRQVSKLLNASAPPCSAPTTFHHLQEFGWQTEVLFSCRKLQGRSSLLAPHHLQLPAGVCIKAVAQLTCRTLQTTSHLTATSMNLTHLLICCRQRMLSVTSLPVLLALALAAAAAAAAASDLPSVHNDKGSCRLYRNGLQDCLLNVHNAPKAIQMKSPDCPHESTFIKAFGRHPACLQYCLW